MLVGRMIQRTTRDIVRGLWSEGMVDFSWERKVGMVVLLERCRRCRVQMGMMTADEKLYADQKTEVAMFT